MAGIYDADIVSNVFVQTPPKEYDFYKKKKKEKLRLLQSFRFRHLQSAPALGEGSICERLKPSSEIKE